MSFLHTDPPWLFYFLGYAFGVVLGHSLVGMVVDQMYENFARYMKQDLVKDGIRPQPWVPQITGVVERILFISALLMGHASFIGVWLAVKTASQWKFWNEEKTRTRFQIFLIGNGLSILYAATGYKIIVWLGREEITIAAVVSICLVSITLLIFLWAKRFEDG